jgi:hypothetical protein
MEAGFKLPPDLDAVVQAITSGNSPQTPEPQPGADGPAVAEFGESAVPRTPSEGEDKTPAFASDGGQSLKNTAPKPERSRKPKAKTKRDKLLALIEAATETGDLGRTDNEIAKLARITSRYLRELRQTDEEIRNALTSYRRASLGRGPAQPKDL